MAQRFIRSSIGRLVLALMLLAVTPAVLLLWQMADRAHAEHVRAAAAAQRQAAGFGVLLFEDLLGTAELALELDGAGDLRWALDPGACTRRLHRLEQGHPFIAPVALVARDGRVICTDRGSGNGISLADRRYIAEAQATDRLVIGSPVVSRLTGERALPIARRIAATRDVPGEDVPTVLAANLDLAWLARVIATAAAAEGVEPRALILDQGGALLASWPPIAPVPADHPTIQSVLAAPVGAIEAVGLDGVARLVGFVHTYATDLVIAVSVPRAAATRAADRQFALALALIALAGAAGVGIAVALARTLVGRPLLALVDAADAVRRGIAQPALPARAMFGEFEMLKLAFARMATAIAHRETALEAANAELENANRLLVDLVERDALTGLANRRAFDAALDAAWKRGLREAAPVAVLIIDLDHFKQFNDRYGHLEGDACLMRVAGLLMAMQLRPYDLAARLGGEEFAVLLPDSDVPGAVAVGERIRAALHDMMLLHEGSPHGFVTASIGAASMVPLGLAEPRVLLAAADRALYAAKAAGRDRVSAGGWAEAA